MPCHNRSIESCPAGASCLGKLLKSIGLVDAMISPQVVFIAGQVFADLLTMLALDPWGVTMQVLHVARYGVSMDELHANRTLCFICL